jgi:hypothetical protein
MTSRSSHCGVYLFPGALGLCFVSFPIASPPPQSPPLGGEAEHSPQRGELEGGENVCPELFPNTVLPPTTNTPPLRDRWCCASIPRPDNKVNKLLVNSRQSTSGQQRAAERVRRLWCLYPARRLYLISHPNSFTWSRRLTIRSCVSRSWGNRVRRRLLKANSVARR